MKKQVAAVAIAIMVLCLSACGEAEESPEKKAARELDSAVWGAITEACDYLQELPDFLQAEDEDSTVDALGVMVDVLRVKQNSLDDLSTETVQETLYVGAARAYVANARVVYESVRDYLADGEQDDYEKFEKYFNMIGDLTTNAVEKRTEFLSSVGFSDSEISEFPAEIRAEN